MKIIKLFFFIACLSWLTSCDNETVEPRTDLKGLQQAITMDFKPVAVKWVYAAIGEERSFGPTDYELTALLKLTKSDKQKLYAQCLKNGKSNVGVLRSDFLKSWFPKSVTSCFQNNGKYTSINTQVFKISALEKSPFVNGFCFFTEEDEVFIYLFTT